MLARFLEAHTVYLVTGVTDMRKRLKTVEALRAYACVLNPTNFLCYEGKPLGIENRSHAYMVAKEECILHMEKSVEMDCLWNAVLAFEGYPFHTAGRGKVPGVKFSYQVKRGRDDQPVGEIKVGRKEKTITRATIELVYRRAKEMSGVVSGPKKLGVFGASYLYPMLVRFGVIQKIEVLTKQI